MYRPSPERIHRQPDEFELHDNILRLDLTQTLYDNAALWTEVYGNYLSTVGAITDSGSQERIAAAISFWTQENGEIEVSYFEVDLLSQKRSSDILVFNMREDYLIDRSGLPFLQLMYAASISSPRSRDTRLLGCDQFAAMAQ